MMEVSQDCINLIKSFEGFSPVPYICPAGKLTIGYGRVITDANETTTREKEDVFIWDYCNKLATQIQQRITQQLSQHQLDALVCFAYNVGVGAFLASTMAKYINCGKMGEAANEFDKWVHAGDRVLPGLVARRKAEKELFQNG